MKSETLRQTLDLKIVSAGHDEAVFHVTVHPDSEVFVGHFPNAPIVPGVILVEAVRAALDHTLKTQWRMTSSNSIKFLAVVDPHAHPELMLKLNFSKVESEVKVDAKFFWGELIFCKIKATYGPLNG